jgi:predicted transcriptional regulator
MVPLSDYALVRDDATLYDAVVALEEAQKRYVSHRYAHRAVLVQDANGQIVGKLSQSDIIRGLEPRYEGMTDSKSLARSGFTASYIRNIMKTQGLWQKPLDNLAQKASETKVAEVMYTPAEGDYVDVDASLDEAIHQLIMGHHQSLLVTSGGKVVGVLRLTDVFHEICILIKDSRRGG